MFIYSTEHVGIYACNLSSCGTEVGGLLYILGPPRLYSKTLSNQNKWRKLNFFWLIAYNEYSVLYTVNYKRSGYKNEYEVYIFCFMIIWIMSIILPKRKIQPNVQISNGLEGKMHRNVENIFFLPKFRSKAFLDSMIALTFVILLE